MPYLHEVKMNKTNIDRAGVVICEHKRRSTNGIPIIVNVRKKIE